MEASAVEVWLRTRRGRDQEGMRVGPGHVGPLKVSNSGVMWI